MLVLWNVAGALTYAELGTVIAESGGEYAYLKGAFGAVPGFLFSWMVVLFLRPAEVAIITLTCAEYVMVPLFDDNCGDPPELHTKLVAATVLREFAGA